MSPPYSLCSSCHREFSTSQLAKGPISGEPICWGCFKGRETGEQGAIVEEARKVLWGPPISGADQVEPGLYVARESHSIFKPVTGSFPTTGSLASYPGCFPAPRRPTEDFCPLGGQHDPGPDPAVARYPDGSYDCECGYKVSEALGKRLQANHPWNFLPLMKPDGKGGYHREGDHFWIDPPESRLPDLKALAESVGRGLENRCLEIRGEGKKLPDLSFRKKLRTEILWRRGDVLALGCALLGTLLGFVGGLAAAYLWFR